MSEAPATFSSSAAADEDDAKFGFQRAEMYKSSLAGTVEPYDRHLFLCYKASAAWPSKVENSDSDPLPKLLFGALRARKDDISVKTRLTVFEGVEGTEFADGDVLIFPEMIKYRGLKELDVDGFVEDVLVNGKPWASGVQEVLAGFHVFVCAHASRDRRCGVCGPALIEKFKEEIDLRGLKDQVFVSGCSHVGGHKYAGNLIIFGADAGGKIAGHWYGYATPDDVAAFLDKHIAKGQTTHTHYIYMCVCVCADRRRRTESPVCTRQWRGSSNGSSSPAMSPAHPKAGSGISALKRTQNFTTKAAA